MSSGAAAAARLGGVPQSSTRTLPSPLSSNRIPKFKSFTLEQIGDLLERLLAEVLDLQESGFPSDERDRPSVRMFEFLSEFTERTDSSRSSIGVRSRPPRRAPSPAPASLDRPIGADECEPKSAKYWKCVCASAAA